jgi:hypothetical protein
MRTTIIKQMIEDKYNWVTGGYENEVCDGRMDESDFPSRQELEQEVYDEIMSEKYYRGFDVRDIRFEGSINIKEMITQEFNKQGEY